MTKIRITKSFNFETAHALYGYDGKCKNIHGHSYKLYVTIIGAPIEDKTNVKYGMVMDFGDLKKIVNKEVVDYFDHAIILNETTPHAELGITLAKEHHKVIMVNYQPSCENMIVDIAQKISLQLPKDIQLHSLKLHETETSYAEWYASDNE